MMSLLSLQKCQATSGGDETVWGKKTTSKVQKQATEWVTAISGNSKQWLLLLSDAVHSEKWTEPWSGALRGPFALPLIAFPSQEHFTPSCHLHLVPDSPLRLATIW